MERLFMVSYLHRTKRVRAMLRVENENEIMPMLLLYHMETKSEVIKILRIREYEKDQRFLHVWYAD